MSANGSKTKAGVTYRNFRCSANKEKGPDACPNCAQVSERKLLTSIVETVRASLGHPLLVKHFEEAFSRYWSAAQRERSSAQVSDGLAAEIRSTTAKRDRVLRAIEEGAGAFDSIKDRLRTLEDQLRGFHQRMLPHWPPKGLAPWASSRGPPLPACWPPSRTWRPSS